MDLLREIVHCPNVAYCLENPSGGHPCTEIVLSQEVPLADRQVPEPWSGHLESAPILFLSSNPSIGLAEDYPEWSWPMEHIEDFFTNRFGGGRKEWITDGRYSLAKSGSRSPAIMFWSAVRLRTAELLNVDVSRVRPGVDYAISEVVHCKSRGEIGVPEARTTCANRYLHRVITDVAARVIVVLGRVAETTVRESFAPMGDVIVSAPTRIGPHDRIFVFLPHPSSFKPKTFASCLSANELASLRSFVSVRKED